MLPSRTKLRGGKARCRLLMRSSTAQPATEAERGPAAQKHSKHPKKKTKKRGQEARSWPGTAPRDAPAPSGSAGCQREAKSALLGGIRPWAGGNQVPAGDKDQGAGDMGGVFFWGGPCPDPFAQPRRRAVSKQPGAAGGEDCFTSGEVMCACPLPFFSSFFLYLLIPSPARTLQR